MAKDGTNRGDRRVRAGDKPTPLTDKITAGKAARVLEGVEFHPETILEPEDLDGAADLSGEDMPTPGDYLSSRQKDGWPLGADELDVETWRWFKARGCERFVNPRLIEAYAQAFTRCIQCEEAISMYGLLGKHATTGGVITSPFVTMSQSFQKQANLLWHEIFDIVKQVPCVFVEHLTEAQKRAYILADNRLALNAGGDADMLSVEISDLQAADFDVSLLGFDDRELEKLFANGEEVQNDEFTQRANTFRRARMEYDPAG